MRKNEKEVEEWSELLQLSEAFGRNHGNLVHVASTGRKVDGRGVFCKPLVF